jgi:hypothetical protein
MANVLVLSDDSKRLHITRRPPNAADYDNHLSVSRSHHWYSFLTVPNRPCTRTRYPVGQCRGGPMATRRGPDPFSNVRSGDRAGIELGVCAVDGRGRADS